MAIRMNFQALHKYSGMHRRVLRFVLPQTLWMRLALLVGIMICLPVLIVSYIVDKQGRAGLLHEKGEKLYGITRLLDDALGDDLILTGEQITTLTRDQQIALLRDRVTRRAEDVVKAYPGVGAGYYHKRLDAIITYAPNETYGYTVGRPILENHQGRRVMSEGVPKTVFGSQVRGDIMNAMWPIKRDGEVIGYIWANELGDSVRKQVAWLDWSILGLLGGGLAVTFGVVLLLSRNFGRDVDIVKDGLRKLQFDLRRPLPVLRGEIGEIAESINAMVAALLEARGLTENILAGIDDGVITIDNDGRITLLNSAALRILGRNPGAVLNTDGNGQVPDPSAFRRLLSDTVYRNVQHTGVEIDYPQSDRILSIVISTTIIRNNKGKSVGAAAFIRDQTSEKVLKHQVARAEQLAAVGELAAGVAHEVRNPLTAIRGFVQYLREDASPAEREEYTGIILNEVDSINRVIQQLLNFARLSPQHYQKVALADAVRDVLVLVKTRSVAGRIAFVLDIDDNAEIEADTEQLKQVLLNLLLNAVQAIEGRGRITVSARANRQDEVELRIGDDGKGVAEEDKARIFAPFFTTKPSGTGLGLAIVQRIISEHGGEIDIESEEGRGTVVILRLPSRARKESP